WESRAGDPRAVGDPIALDLDGNGAIEYLNKDQVDIFFADSTTLNFGADVGWIGSGDGLLALDLNGDGKITHAGELLGNGTVSALLNLRQNYDTDTDGVLDANDAHFADFRIWQDANTNGITDAGELKLAA